MNMVLYVVLFVAIGISDIISAYRCYKRGEVFFAILFVSVSIICLGIAGTVIAKLFEII